VLTIAAEFDLVSGLLTVIAAVLTKRATRFDVAITRRVSALRWVGHQDTSGANSNPSPRRLTSENDMQATADKAEIAARENGIDPAIARRRRRTCA
jgi:hypothetical protein